MHYAFVLERVKQELEKIERRAAAERAASDERHKLAAEKAEKERTELMQVDHALV